MLHSQILTNDTYVNSSLLKSLLITLICPIISISHIAQLLLIRNFYCFRKGQHIFFKYARHNHLRCPMMGELSLET